MSRLNVAFSILFILGLLITWIVVLIKILRTPKGSIPNGFVEFYVGMKRSKWRVFISNFYFIFMRLMIGVLAGVFKDIIDS